MNSKFVVGLVLAASISVMAAKTPQQLKDELSDILPAGKKARLAWLKGGFQRGDWDGDNANLPGARDKSLYVLDSDNGIVRELTPASMFPGETRDIDAPNITFDGSRVIFAETYSDMKYVINWDGTGLKPIEIEGYLSRYWHDYSNGTDWVTVDSYGIQRVNIDNPTQRVLLWNKSDVSRPWYTLSRDGTRMALNCPHPEAGIAEVPNGNLTKITLGCFINISPDNNYQILPQNGDHSVHTIYDMQGNIQNSVNTSSTILAGWPNPTLVPLNGCKTEESEYEGTRWVHSDYLTFFFYATSVNPFVECISTGKWMYIHDQEELGMCGFAGNMDMVILDASVANQRDFAVRRSGIAGSESLYSINGRALKQLNNRGKAHQSMPIQGIAISKSASRILIIADE